MCVCECVPSWGWISLGLETAPLFAFTGWGWVWRGSKLGAYFLIRILIPNVPVSVFKRTLSHSKAHFKLLFYWGWGLTVGLSPYISLVFPLQLRGWGGGL